MGGKISRNVIAQENGLPINFYKVDISNGKTLYGSCLPVTNHALKYFQNECNIGLVITLLLEPLKCGRNVNHSSGDKTDPEWHDTDKDLFHDISLKFLHVPIQDGYPPTNKSIDAILEKSKEMIDGGKNVLFHCWQGKGRTGTCIVSYLMHHEKLTFEEAFEKLKIAFPEYRITEFQQEYLMSESFPKNDKEARQPALIIETRSVASCYKKQFE